jgi:hypothetical protein
MRHGGTRSFHNLLFASILASSLLATACTGGSSTGGPGQNVSETLGAGAGTAAPIANEFSGSTGVAQSMKDVKLPGYALPQGAGDFRVPGVNEPTYGVPGPALHVPAFHAPNLNLHTPHFTTHIH